MSRTRREFIKDAAVAGVVLSAAAEAGTGHAESKETDGASRCPYFDQPMYCDGLSPNGKPLCEQ